MTTGHSTMITLDPVIQIGNCQPGHAMSSWTVYTAATRPRPRLDASIASVASTQWKSFCVASPVKSQICRHHRKHLRGGRPPLINIVVGSDCCLTENTITQQNNTLHSNHQTNSAQTRRCIITARKGQRVIYVLFFIEKNAQHFASDNIIISLLGLDTAGGGRNEEGVGSIGFRDPVLSDKCGRFVDDLAWSDYIPYCGVTIQQHRLDK